MNVCDHVKGVRPIAAGERMLSAESPVELPEQTHNPDQLGSTTGDSALVALALFARCYEIELDPLEIAHELGFAGRAPSPTDLVRAAALKGLSIRLLSQQDETILGVLRRPALMLRSDGRYIVVFPSTSSEVIPILDPEDHWGKRAPIRVKREVIRAAWSGEIFVVTTRPERGSSIDDFGVTWFIQALWRYRRPLSHVLLASLFIQLFALITPLFFQIVIDKVLVHRAAATLTVVTVGLVVIGLFDAILQYLRSYAVAHTSNRLDVELGTRLFRHLLQLPLSYFETRPTGQTVARVRELESIRSFLTGPGLTSLVDIFFAILLIAVLFLYSGMLTTIVLGSMPLYAIVAAVFRPVLRAKLAAKYNRGAASQQFLVESVVGVHTLKAAAIEPLIERQWSDRLTSYVRASFQAQMVASMGQSTVQYLSKLNTAALLFFGAHEVINGRMTVGGLVAFNMISVQVFSPIVRLSQLWQDFQQVQVSADRLGDIFRAQPEEQPVVYRRMKRMSGAVQLRDVHFRYYPRGPYVLEGVNLEVPAGQVIGIVGPSGSGKSTLTKLVQRLYTPDHGVVAIDGVDVAQLRISWVRSQLGVVLQDNLLFNRTVRENIALATPHLDFESVLAVSKLAGADEFIARLPQGYDSQIVERGANLSGGQRQRIAIARALARDPRILILDEATSALDYESERIIQDNMRAIVRGRTVIIIAHRLAAVRHCDRIIGMVQGRIVEDGTHKELLLRSHGLYAHLWELQSAGAQA
jgi:subfamily B ATP-binding cassette protein HlyB/CyaB